MKLLSRKIWIKRFRLVHGKLYKYHRSVFKGKRTNIIIYHTICGRYFNQKPNNHANGSGCTHKECVLKRIKLSRMKSNEEIEKAFRKVHGKKYIYNDDYRGNTDKDYTITCPDHGDFKCRPNSHKAGHGCPKCKFSRGERLLDTILTRMKLKYTLQKRFKECKNKIPLPFDVHIEKGQKYKKHTFKNHRIIEWDGEHHDNVIKHHGGLEKFRQTIKHDNIKNTFCIQNNIKLIRISWKLFGKNPSIESVQNHLIKELKKSFKTLKSDLKKKEKQQLKTLTKYENTSD